MIGFILWKINFSRLLDGIIMWDHPKPVCKKQSPIKKWKETDWFKKREGNREFTCQILPAWRGPLASGVSWPFPYFAWSSRAFFALSSSHTGFRWNPVRSLACRYRLGQDPHRVGCLTEPWSLFVCEDLTRIRPLKVLCVEFDTFSKLQFPYKTVKIKIYRNTTQRIYFDNPIFLGLFKIAEFMAP